MISTVVSTIGAPFAVQHLQTFPFLGELIVVIDKVGRAASKLDEAYPLEQFREDVLRVQPLTRFVTYDPPPGKWAVQNGCYNWGIAAAKYDWVLCTHDDVSWPSASTFSYWHVTQRAIHWIENEHWPREPRTTVGFILPEFEVTNKVQVPTFSSPHPVLCQAVSPVSQVIHRTAWQAMGRFDEEYGVWYDGQLEKESELRGWWYVYLPTPSLLHQSNATYRVNNWGNRWKANPIWNNYAANFKRKYGVPPGPRKLSTCDPAVLPGLERLVSA